MKHILINPVASVMYKDRIIEIHTKLHSQNYEIVEFECQQDIVREKYRTVCNECENMIIDNRCPAAIEFIDENVNLKGVTIPNIEPILIHTARYLYEKYLMKNEYDTLTITTPCESLKKLGIKIFKKENKSRIYFKTWNEICDILDIQRVTKRTHTPIPMGFFKELEIPILEISGENQIQSTLKQVVIDIKQPKLVEILYCKDGCHNGDGV